MINIIYNNLFHNYTPRVIGPAAAGPVENSVRGIKLTG
jgi:hypothetical protein